MSRPGVFFTTRRDGCLDVWDLFFKHQEPTLQVLPRTCLVPASRVAPEFTLQGSCKVAAICRHGHRVRGAA